MPPVALAGLRAGAQHHQAGRLREAEAAYRDALRLAPDHPEILHVLGLVAYQLGRSGEAVTLLGQAVALGARSAASHDNYGLALRAAGRIEEAIAEHRRAVALDRQSPGSNFNLGAVLAAAGRPEDAIPALRRALAAAPNFSDALSVLGQCYARTGQTELAVSVLRRAIAAQPGFAEAHLNLGVALATSGRSNEAIVHLEEAARLEPRGLDAVRNIALVRRSLGDVESAATAAEQVLAADPNDAEMSLIRAEALRRSGKAKAALAAYAHAAALAPDMWEAHQSLAGLLLARGAIDEAERAYRACLAARPKLAEAVIGLGRCEQARGRFDAAEAHYRDALALDAHQAAARENLATIGRLAPGDAEVAALEATLARTDIEPAQRISAHFALARLREQEERMEETFAHWREANELQKTSARFDPSVFAAELAAVMAVFDSNFFRERAEWGHASAAPVFIVGMPRSGTTLAEQILASHPSVAPGGERYDLGDLADEAQARAGGHGGFPHAIRRLDRSMASDLARRYLASGPQVPAPRVTDKLPGNFIDLWLAALMFPKARVINCVRDPMDVGLSCYAQNFGETLTFSCDLAHIGAYIRGWRTLMAHWRAVLPLPIHDFVYEDVVADQERATRALLDFCGLPWNARCLAFHETERPILTASNWQARQPLYAGSVGRWKRYAAHLEPLRAALEGAPP